MLLRSVRAVNFLRFREISIPEFPLVGIVAVEAVTPEDRKAFRDLLMFALFGRIDEGKGDPANLIRDGAEYAFVEVEFDHPLAGEVAVRRGLARHGRAPVSLHESAADRILSGEGDVAARLTELVGGDVPGFLRRGFPDVPAVGAAPGRDAGAATVDDLVRDRNRVRGRVRRARGRLEKLEAGGEVRAEAEALRLEAALPQTGAVESPGRAPEVDRAVGEVDRFGELLRREMAEAVVEARRRALLALSARIVGGKQHAEEEWRRIDAERTAARALLDRTEEYEVRLRDLRRSILLASDSADDAAAGPPVLPSLRPGLAMLALALVLVAGLLILNDRLPRGHWLLSVLNPAITLLVLLDVWFALKLWRHSDRREEPREATGSGVTRDPVMLIDDIEREFPDVIAEYEDGLTERLRSRLEASERGADEARAARERRDALFLELQAEWPRARAAVPGLPAAPAAGAGEADGSAVGAGPTGSDLRAAVDSLVAAAAGPGAGSGGGRPATDSTLAGLKRALGEALRAAGDERTADDMVRGAGLTAARAPSPTPEERERRIAGFETALRAELAGLRGRPGSSGSGSIEERKARLEELAPAAASVREVRARLAGAEAELEEILEGLRAARQERPAAGPDLPDGAFLVDVDGFVPEEGVVAVHRDAAGGFLLRKEKGPDVPVAAGHGLSTLLLLLRAIRDSRGGAGTAPSFLVLDPTSFPGPFVESRALLGFVGRAAPEIRQVVVTGPEGTWPAGAGLTIRPV